MKIDIGVSVKTRDGEEIGKVERVVINPASGEVDGLVVHRGAILSRDVVVPLSLMEGTDTEGVRLRIGRAELVRLPDFVAKRYRAMKPGEPVVPTYTPASVLFPLAPPYGAAGVPAPYDLARPEWQAPPQDVDISEGTEVRAVDGPIGVVDEVLTDALTNHASFVVVSRGEGAGRKVSIPAEFIDEVAEDHIKVSLTLQQVEQLPEPTRDQYLTSESPEGGEKSPGR